MIGPLGTNLSEISIKIQTFFTEENVFENVVCNQVETDRISKYVLEIKDVLEFKDART